MLIWPTSNMATEGVRRHSRSIPREFVELVTSRRALSINLETCQRHTDPEEGRLDSNVSSYRPVSNLPHPSKLLERIANRQLITHLEQHKLLPDIQSTYRRGHSTETADLKVYSDIIDAISNGKFALLSLLDFTAALDTVDHDILLRRLDTTFSFRGAILKLLGS